MDLKDALKFITDLKEQAAGNNQERHCITDGCDCTWKG